ncbi:hypothetical protein [Aquirufa antheringensis]|uniref:hypothetical protein n=1 Tax=Aquirufa antheringensis TaxID=2516559 RepID=UPI0022A90ACD|nr:hypothetical protein [Aquirufa antheringensis]MCZ2489399.1 hypothetical protein [Aquirufa antheringensis]
MKHSIRLLFLLLIGFQSINHAFGQETVFKIKKDTSSSSMKTLFKPHKLTSFGVSLQSQMLFGKGGPERSMGFQVHLNNKLSLGIASFNSNPRNDDPNRYADEPRRRFNALTMEVTPMANKVFHLSFPLAIGRIQEEAPLINYPAYPGTAYQPLPYRQSQDRFSNGPRALGVQPGINLEVNLFKYVKVFGGANYRFAFGEEKTAGMAKAAGTIGVKVGVFDYRKKR